MNVNDKDETPNDDMLIGNDFIPVLEDVEITDESNEEDSDVVDDEDVIDDEDTNTDDVNNYSEESDDIAIGTYKTLVEKGIFAETEEFDGSWESLEEQFTKLPEVIADNIIQNTPDAGKKLMEYMFSKDNLSHDDLKDYFKLVDEDVSNSITIETLADARMFLTNEYKNKGLESDDIEAMLDNMEDKGDDYVINKAKKLDEVNKKSYKSQADSELERVKQQKQLQQENSAKLYNEINKELKTLNYKTTRTNAIKTNLRSDVLQKKNTIIRKSPKALIQLADFYSYFNEETGEFDLSNYTVQAESKKTEKRKKNLIRDNFNSSGQGKRTKRQSKSNDDELVPIF